MKNKKVSFEKLRRRYAKYRNHLIVITQLESSFAEFFRREAAGGIMLLFCTASALLFANLPQLNFLNEIWKENILFSFGDTDIRFTLQDLVNDGLMTVFFFVAGLEIKRELRVGELSSFKQASLPIIAATGGMLMPALIYKMVNFGPEIIEAGRGWGIPMATDIAFAVGVISLIGKMVPLSLKVFLVALSIVDDLGAILVIAFFYPSHDLHPNMLLWAAGVFAILLLFNLTRMKSTLLFLAGGFVLWLLILRSGVHATIAGVLLAISIPSRSRINEMRFYVRGTYLLNKFKAAYTRELDFIANKDEQEIVERLAHGIDNVRPMAIKLERGLHPLVMFVVMPLFALANAGVAFGSGMFEQLTSSVSVGILLGLVVGKPLGILAFTYIGVKLKITGLPDKVAWKHILSVGCLAGIGFTMSLFINDLAFESGDFVSIGKISILAGSLVAGLTGWLMCRGTMNTNR